VILFESRASVVLYKYLLAYREEGFFLLPANICPIVPITFLKAKVPFEFVDIDSRNFCINEEIVTKKIRSRPKKYAGILFNHTYGVDYSPTEFFSGLKNSAPHLKIIDDRCLCIPAIVNPSENSTLIDLILFSTGFSKYANIGFGGIGILRSNNYSFEEISDTYEPKDLENLELQYKHTINSGTRYEYKETNWLDCRIPDENYAAYLGKVNDRIDSANAHKAKLNSIYSANLDYKMRYSPEFQKWRFNIKVPDKNALLKKIFSSELFASSLYASLGEGIFSEKHFPIASKMFEETINLFNDFCFNEDQALSVCKIVNQHVSGL